MSKKTISLFLVIAFTFVFFGCDLLDEEETETTETEAVEEESIEETSDLQEQLDELAASEEDEDAETIESFITLDSPSDSTVYTDTAAPIEFTGEVSPDTLGITISAAFSASDESLALDDYALQEFVAGDETFVYRAKIAWKNLGWGENIYTFTAHFKDGTTESTSVTIFLEE